MANLLSPMISIAVGGGVLPTPSVPVLPPHSSLPLVQSLLNNLTSPAASATPQSIFSGLQVQVPGLPLDVGFPFLVENVLPPRLNTSILDQQFKTLRSVWSPELVVVRNTGSEAVPSFDTSSAPLLDAGQPFTLLAALPQPGTVVSLPKTVNASATSATNGFANNTFYTIPENAFTTSKWNFFKSDNGTWAPVRNEYQVLNGSVFSTTSSTSQYVFYPAPDGSSIRSIVGCLNTTIFIPDGNNQTLVAPPLCLGGRINSWSSVFGDISGGVIRNYAGTRGLFHVEVDTNAPLPGRPINILVNPIDKPLPSIVDTIVDSAPDLKVSAAIDIGAPLNAFIGAGVKAISGLFGSSDKVASSVLTVAGVLDGLLTIPIALDLKGRSVVKTLKPVAGSVQNVLPLADGLVGTLPIGSLVASIESTVNNISLVLPDQAIQEPLPGLHGVAMTLFPSFVSAGAGAPSKISIPITLKPQITLPGMSKPLINEIYLGDITVVLPRITLPQMAFLFHDPGFRTTSANSILVAIDPITYRGVSQASELKIVLEALVATIDLVRKVFREFSLADDIDKLATTASMMLGFIEAAPSKPGKGWINIVNVNMPGPDFYVLGRGDDDFTHGKDPGVSSVLWLGLPSIYRFWMRYGNGWAVSFTGGPGNRFSGAIYDDNYITSGICLKGPGAALNDDSQCKDFDRTDTAEEKANGKKGFSDSPVLIQYVRSRQ